MFKPIKGKRVDLIAIQEEHKEEIYAYASDYETTQYMSWPRHESIDDTIKFINMTREQYATGAHYDWAVYHKADAKVIGTCGLPLYDRIQNSVQAGYIIAKQYWNQGLGSEILGMLVRFGFTELKLHTIEAFCEQENFASERIMQKNGFSYAGIFSYKLIKSKVPIEAKKYILHSSAY